MSGKSPWRDRPEEGKSRPTPERLRKGRWILADTEDAGVRYAIDLHSDPVALAAHQGLLDQHHVDAFRKFEEMARKMMGSPSQRSCLDFTPVGHDDDRRDDEDLERAWKDVRAYLGGQYLGVALAMAYEHVTAPRVLVRETGERLASFFKTA